VLQRRRTRDSVLVFARNFSGARRRILPRGDSDGTLNLVG
jgi:hypothetical protein